jgi:hypothetical protein
VAISESELKSQIGSYIAQKGGAYRTWYVGITNEPDRRLFDEHGVDKSGAWVHGSATSNTVARRVEQHFIKLGCDGAPGGGDVKSKGVYAYKKTASTKP